MEEVLWDVADRVDAEARRVGLAGPEQRAAQQVVVDRVVLLRQIGQAVDLVGDQLDRVVPVLDRAMIENELNRLRRERLVDVKFSINVTDHKY